MAYVETGVKIDDFPLGENRLFRLGAAEVALFHTAEGIFALDEVCPHRGAPMHEGSVSAGEVTCPWHQWQFDVKTGICRNIPGARIPAYPVECRDGMVWIDLENQGGAK